VPKTIKKSNPKKSRTERRQLRQGLKRLELMRRGNLKGTTRRPKKTTSQKPAISEEKYGAEKKKWKNPQRAGERLTKIVMNGEIGPHGGQRRYYLDKVIGPWLFEPVMKGEKVVRIQLSRKIVREAFREHRKTGRVILPKSFEHIVLDMTLRRAFASISLPDKPKRVEVAEAMKHLHKAGKISFDNNTHVVFTKSTINQLSKQLGPKTNEFKQNFKKYLLEETGHVREYIHEAVQRTTTHDWIWKGEFKDRILGRSNANKTAKKK